MTSRESVSDVIIDRAVELWCRALRNPQHDNGDKSLAGVLTAGLAGENAARAIDRVDDYAGAIERFRSILTARLRFLRDHHGEPTGEHGPYGPIKHHFDHGLHADYSPERELAKAAEEAGVPLNAFPWKSSVWMSTECVSASFGYAAEDIYHYPLDRGRWLVCRLRGSDMRAVIAAVEAGILTSFTVEDPAPVEASDA